MARSSKIVNDAPGPSERPRSSIGALRGIIPYLKPYKGAIVASLVALIIAASAVLVMGVGLRSLVDHGFSGGNEELLDDALIGLLKVFLELLLWEALPGHLVQIKKK